MELPVLNNYIKTDLDCSCFLDALPAISPVAAPVVYEAAFVSYVISKHPGDSPIRISYAGLHRETLSELFAELKRVSFVSGSTKDVEGAIQLVGPVTNIAPLTLSKVELPVMNGAGERIYFEADGTFTNGGITIVPGEIKGLYLFPVTTDALTLNKATAIYVIVGADSAMEAENKLHITMVNPYVRVRGQLEYVVTALRTSIPQFIGTYATYIAKYSGAELKRVMATCLS